MTKFFSRLTAGLLTATFLFTQNFALAQEITNLIPSNDERNISKFEHEILEEVISKREECVKHFRKSDLSMVAVLYSEPVHYKDSDGKFKEIDNSLTENGNEYQNTDTPFKIRFSKNFDNKKLVTINSEGHEVSWGYIKKDRKIIKKANVSNEAQTANQETEVENKITDESINYWLKKAKKDSEIKSISKTKITQEIAEISGLKPEAAQIENFKTGAKNFANKKEELTDVSKCYSKAKYKNADPELDFDYALSGLGLKENIILNKKLEFSENDTFDFEFKTNGLKIEKDNFGNLNFKDKDGKVVLIMPKGSMWDSAEIPNYSNDVDYKFTETENGYIISVVPNKEWLKNAVYPVTIDPSLNYPSSAISIIDTMASQSDPTNPHPTHDHLPVGRWVAGDDYESYVKFDNLPTFTRGEIITSASFKMYYYSYMASQSNCILARKILKANDKTWDKTSLTWNNKPPVDPTIIDYINVNEYKTYSLNLTRFIKEAYCLENPNSNDGIMLSSRLSENNQDGLARFASTSNPNNKPTLEIEYRNFIGEEPYWSYTSHDAGLKGNGKVNNYAGTLSVSEDILEYSGARNSLSIGNTYNATNFKGHANTYIQKENFVGGYKHSASTGLGFSLDFNQMIYEIPSTGESQKMYAKGFRYLYIDDDGTWHYFKRTDDTETAFIDEDGLYLKITKDGLTKLIITDKQDNKLTFENKDSSNQGQPCFVLIFSEDNDGNEIEYIYSTPLDANSQQIFPDAKVTTIKEKLSKNTSVDDRITNVIYNEDGSSKGLVSAIIMPNDGTTNSRTISFSYDGDKLKEITYPDGLKTGYEYDQQGRLSRVRTNEGTGSSVEYKYASNEIKSANFYKVRSVTEYGSQSTDLKTAGNSTCFDYGINQTKIIHKINNLDVPYHENTEIWQFDHDGSTTSVIDEQGNMISNLYEKATEESEKNKKHKIKHANDTGKYTNNLLKNFDARHGTETVNGVVKPKNWELKNWNFDHVQSGNCCGIEVSESDFHLGTKSFKVWNSANHQSWPIAEQKVSIKPSKRDRKYTLSGDIKVINALNGGNGASLHLASFKGETQQAGDDYSTWLHSTDGDWRRVSITINVPADSDSIKCYFGIKNSEGTAYFDCLQLEESEFANDYNMVENSSFEYDRDGAKGMFNWDTWQIDASKVVENGRIRIDGNPTLSRAVFQDIAINKNNAVLAVRAQAQGLSVPTTDIGGSPSFQIGCKLSFENGPEDCWAIILFNSSISEVQAVYESIDANSVLNEYQKKNNLPIENKKLLSIRIESNFHYNCNTAYFDNIQVCDDDYGVVYNRNDKGSVTEITGSIGNKTTFTRDSASDEVTNIKDQKNNETDFSYKTSPKQHQMESSTIPTAGGRVKTNFAHDSFGNVIETLSQAESGQGKIIKSSAGYTNSGNYQNSATDFRNKTTTFNYNENNGNLNSTTTHNNVTTNYTYDAENRMTSESCSGSQINYNYSNGELSSVSHKLDEGINIVYNFVRDIFGKITGIKVGDHVLTTNTYDAGNGKLNQEKFANNQQVRYEYDAAGRLVKKYYHSGKDKQNGTFEYSYNNKNNLVQTFDEENNLTTKFEYDKYGRIVHLKRSDDIFSNIKYNPLENLVDKVISKIFETRQTIENTFGASNKFENSKITIGNNSMWSKYFYNALGQVQSKETLNADETTGLKHEISYVNEGANNTTDIVESINIQKKVDGNWIQLNKNFSYEYDDVGNISVFKENETPKIWYYYDGNNQLVRENNRYLGPNGQTIKYIYDFGGNIQEKKIYDFTENNDDGDLASLTAETITYGYHNDNWKDQLSTYNGQEIIYDGMGNPITYKDGWKFEWVRGKKLDKASKIGYNVNYKYDDAGIRTKKTVNDVTTDFITSGIQILAQKCGNDVIVWQIDGTGSSVGFDYNGTPYFYVKNTQGDIIGITDANGELIAEYVYDSWGKLLNEPTGIGAINPLRYRGYYYDNETGLYYLNARYYDPETGRFLNADDDDFLLEDDNDILDYNLYAYCGNNPVNMSDPDGEFAQYAMAGLGSIFAGFSAFGSANFWNPVGWTILGVAAVGVALYGGYHLSRYISQVYKANAQKREVKFGTRATYATASSNSKKPNNKNENNKRPQKERKFNVKKGESKIWKKFKNVKGRDYRISGSRKNQKYYRWDHTHNDIEVYNSAKKHIGSMDPITGKIYKGPVPGRTL